MRHQNKSIQQRRRSRRRAAVDAAVAAHSHQDSLWEQPVEQLEQRQFRLPPAQGASPRLQGRQHNTTSGAFIPQRQSPQQTWYRNQRRRKNRATLRRIGSTDEQLQHHRYSRQDYSQHGGRMQRTFYDDYLRDFYFAREARDAVRMYSQQLGYNAHAPPTAAPPANATEAQVEYYHNWYFNADPYWADARRRYYDHVNSAAGNYEEYPSVAGWNQRQRHSGDGGRRAMAGLRKTRDERKKRKVAAAMRNAKRQQRLIAALESRCFAPTEEEVRAEQEAAQRLENDWQRMRRGDLAPPAQPKKSKPTSISTETKRIDPHESKPKDAAEAMAAEYDGKKGISSGPEATDKESSTTKDSVAPVEADKLVTADAGVDEKAPLDDQQNAEKEFLVEKEKDEGALVEEEPSKDVSQTAAKSVSDTKDSQPDSENKEALIEATDGSESKGNEKASGVESKNEGDIDADAGESAENTDTKVGDKTPPAQKSGTKNKAKKKEIQKQTDDVVSRARKAMDVYRRVAPLLKLVQAGNVPQVRKFLKKAEDSKELVSLGDKKGLTPVMHAIKLKNFKLVKVLCKEMKEEDANATDRAGNTALHMACKIKNMDMIKLLLKAGADPAVKNNAGKFCHETGGSKAETNSIRSMVRDAVRSNNSPPVLTKSIPDQKAFVGQPFSLVLPADTFKDADGDELGYSVQGLPASISFTPGTRKFFGAPRVEDAKVFGQDSANTESWSKVWVIQVYAGDAYCMSGTSFKLTIFGGAEAANNPPLVKKKIPKQYAVVGVPWKFVFDDKTFYDADGDELTYEVEGLPDSISFDPRTRTFSGTPVESDAIVAKGDDMQDESDEDDGEESEEDVALMAGALSAVKADAEAVLSEVTAADKEALRRRRDLRRSISGVGNVVYVTRRYMISVIARDEFAMASTAFRLTIGHQQAAQEIKLPQAATDTDIDTVDGENAAVPDAISDEDEDGETHEDIEEEEDPRGTESRVDIEFSCRNLISKDTFSKSDPIVAVYCRPLGSKESFVVVGKTETINNNHAPDFKTRISVSAWTKQKQEMRVGVYDADDKTIREKDLIGTCTLPLEDFMKASQKGDKQLQLPLVDAKGKPVLHKKKPAVVICRAPGVKVVETN